MYLVDTDICSAYLKNDRRVFARFVQYGGGLRISAVTVGELTTWCYRRTAPGARLRDFDELTKLVTILPFSYAVAKRFGEVRAILLDTGRPVPDTDLMIAATALHHGLSLVTHNTRHYASVPGLVLEDWLV